MGILDRNKSPAVLSKTSMQSGSTPNGTKQQFATTNSSHLKAIGSKKASYSFLTNNNVENLDPYHPAEFCHDNPVFESELVDKEGASRVFDSETKIVITSINKNPDNKNLPQQINSDTSDLEPNETKLNTSETLSLTNEATLVLQKSQKKGSCAVSSSNTTLVYTGSAQGSRLQDNTELLERSTSSYNTAEKLAAAAAVVSSSSNSIVEIPNFGEGLTSMMEQSRMDEVETGKSFETKINKSHGFIYGEGNSLSKKQLTKSENVPQDDDCGMKSTKFSAYDMKLRRRKSCQLKALVVFLAMLAAACIGVIIAYFFVKYSNEHEKYLRYTQNMVAERETLPGSNKLEIIVPFEANLKNMIYDDKVALTKKIKEIVLKSFRNMNKTVVLIDVYKLVEGNNGFHEAYIDVQLKNALDFSYAPLTVGKKTGRISLARSSKLLSNYQNILRNTTKLAFRHIKRDFLNLDFDKISIAFDEKKQNETNGTITKDNKLIIEEITNKEKMKEVPDLLTDKIIGLKKSLSNNKKATSKPQSDSVFVQEYVVVGKKPLDKELVEVFIPKDSITNEKKQSTIKSFNKDTIVATITTKAVPNTTVRPKEKMIITSEPSTTTTTEQTTSTTTTTNKPTTSTTTTESTTTTSTTTTESTTTTTTEPTTSTIPRTTESTSTTTTSKPTSTTTASTKSELLTTTKLMTSLPKASIKSKEVVPKLIFTTEQTTTTTTEPITTTVQITTTTIKSTTTTAEPTISTTTTVESTTSTSTEPTTSTKTAEPTTTTKTVPKTTTTTEPTTTITTEPSTTITTTEPTTTTTTEPTTTTTTKPSTTITTTEPTTTTTTEPSTTTTTEPFTSTTTTEPTTTTTSEPTTTTTTEPSTSTTTTEPTTTTAEPTTSTIRTTTTQKPLTTTVNNAFHQALLKQKLLFQKTRQQKSSSTTSEPPKTSSNKKRLMLTDQTSNETPTPTPRTKQTTPTTTTRNSIFHQALLKQKQLFEKSKKSSTELSPKTDDLFTSEDLILVKSKRIEKTTQPTIKTFITKNQNIENKIISKLRRLIIEPTNNSMHDESLDTVEFDIGFKAA